MNEKEGRAWPEDVRPQWFNLIRRLQSIASDGKPGFAVIAIKVLVDQDGVPVFWIEPKREAIEPKRRREVLESILEMLTD